METQAADDTQVSCKFVTNLPDQYRFPTAEIAVPSKLTRYGLSKVVNHLLALEKPIPFDFLIDGVLLRFTLAKHLLSHDISAESILEIEYIFAVTPPEKERQLQHDDWVSAVLGSRQHEILSGSYDGTLKIWNGEGKVISSSQVHDGPLSSLESLPSHAELVLSAGKLDHVIRLLKVPTANCLAEEGEPTCVATYKGHAGSVFSVAANPEGNKFVSASQDASLRIWATGPSTVESAVDQGYVWPKKKKKKLQDAKAVLAATLEISSDATLLGHTDAVTSVAWRTEDSIFSGSMDHSIRRWDAEYGKIVEIHNDRKAICCISVSQDASLVAYGGASKSLYIWDPRQRHSEDSGVKTRASHLSFLTAISWHPSSPLHLVSASMDATVKLWDLRSALPLHTLSGHTEKVLDVAWWHENKIISGSADNTVMIYDVQLSSLC